jgi:hypothetical protein
MLGKHVIQQRVQARSGQRARKPRLGYLRGGPP